MPVTDPAALALRFERGIYLNPVTFVYSGFCSSREGKIASAVNVEVGRDSCEASAPALLLHAVLT